MSNDIVQLMQQQDLLASTLAKKSAEMQEILPAAVRIAEDTAQDLAQLTETTAAQTALVTDEMLANAEQLSEAQANPLSSVLGLFDDRYSIPKLKSKLTLGKLKLERLRQQYTMQKEAADTRLRLAETKTNAISKELAATAQAFSAFSSLTQTRIQALQMQQKEKELALDGATIDELQSALTAAQPELIYPTAKIGDLRRALRAKKTEQANYEKAVLAAKVQELEFSQKTKEAAEKNILQYLVELPATKFMQNYAAAQAADAQGQVYQIGDLQIPMPFWERAAKQRATTKKEARDARRELVEQEAEVLLNNTQADAEINAFSSRLYRFANTFDGGGFPAAFDESIAGSFGWVPDKYKAAYQRIQQALEIANAQADPFVSSALFEDAQKQIAELEKQMEEDVKQQIPKSAQPGTLEFLNNGQISSLDNAAGVLAANTSPLLLDDLTRPGWADALQIVNDEFLAVREVLESKSADALAAMFPELTQGSQGIARTAKDSLAMKRALQSLAETGAVSAAQAQMLDQWWAQYTLTVLKEAQDRGVPGFENLVTDDLMPGPALIDEATGQFGPQSVLRALEERSRELAAQNALPLGKTIVDMFLAEYTNRSRLNEFYANVIAPRTNLESALALPIFQNRQMQAFFSRIGDIYGAVPRVRQVVERSEVQRQISETSPSGLKVPSQITGMR